MSFGATFEDSDAAPDDESQVASSSDYLAKLLKRKFEQAWAARRPGKSSFLGKDLIHAILRDIDAGVLVATEEQRAWIAAEALASQDEFGNNPIFSSSAPRDFVPERDWRLDAHAANQARAAAQSVHPGIGDFNIVITLTDAARVFAYRGLNELSRRLKILADRFEPIR